MHQVRLEAMPKGPTPCVNFKGLKPTFFLTSKLTLVASTFTTINNHFVIYKLKNCIRFSYMQFDWIELSYFLLHPCGSHHHNSKSFIYSFSGLEIRLQGLYKYPFLTQFATLLFIDLNRKFRILIPHYSPSFNFEL